MHEQRWIDRHRFGWLRILDDEGFWLNIVAVVILLPLLVGLVLLAVTLIG